VPVKDLLVAAGFKFSHELPYNYLEYPIDNLIVCFTASNSRYDDISYSPLLDLQNNDSHFYWFHKIVNPIDFDGINLDKFDSYMLGDNDISPFQQRSLDTDLHMANCSLKSTRFFINALDVLHSYTVLGSGVKVDAIVGRVNEMTMFFFT